MRLELVSDFFGNEQDVTSINPILAPAQNRRHCSRQTINELRSAVVMNPRQARSRRQMLVQNRDVAKQLTVRKSASAKATEERRLYPREICNKKL